MQSLSRPVAVDDAERVAALCSRRACQESQGRRAGGSALDQAPESATLRAAGESAEWGVAEGITLQGHGEKVSAPIPGPPAGVM